MELCSMLCASLDGSRLGRRMDTRIRMAESYRRFVNQLYFNTKLKV